MESSTIRAFQRHLSTFKPGTDCGFGESFAIRRFNKKYERPDNSRVAELSQLCWNQFITHDSGLPDKLLLPDSLWYKARSLIHSWMKDFDLGEVDISNGSAFTPTDGYNSIAQKLRSAQWDYTPDAIEMVIDAVLSCRALRRSLEMRFRMFCRSKRHCSRRANKFLWKELSGPNRIRDIIRVKLESVSSIQMGSRFSSVVKNNEKRRPINLECLLNMICQRRVGNGLRQVLLHKLGLDLDTLADTHRHRIATKIATIDLKNASDSVTMALVRFLFPSSFVKLIEQCRSPMVLGPDDMYYCLKKVSSMGNGFTFELMTVILTAVCRTLDPTSSVFGDDIIIESEHAPRLIKALENVHFIVNEEKSFINGPFRESCGANYHDDFGYIESYDFLWPESIGDCVVIMNKVMRLRRIYPSFDSLSKVLLRAVPKAWRGPLERGHVAGPLPFDLPTFFAVGGHCPPSVLDSKSVKASRSFFEVSFQRELTYHELFINWKFVPEKVGKPVHNIYLPHHWHKYFMYMSSGTACDDVVRGRGDWVSYLSHGNADFNSSWKSVTAAHKAATDSIPKVTYT